MVHKDIKASNALLDSELNGSFGDFGLSRLYDHGTDPQTTHVVGTLGYLAPEHTRTGLLNKLENVIVKLFEEVELVLKLGLLCSHCEALTRPSMRQVLRDLERDLPLPDLCFLSLDSMRLTSGQSKNFQGWLASPRALATKVENERSRKTIKLSETDYHSLIDSLLSDYSAGFTDSILRLYNFMPKEYQITLLFQLSEITNGVKGKKLKMYVKLDTLGDIALFCNVGSFNMNCYALSNPNRWGYQSNSVYVSTPSTTICKVISADDKKLQKCITLPTFGEAKFYIYDWCFKHLQHEIDYSLVE
ncbi:hypothetical protein P8452_13726 [Trifolium repens]|nr:hypothetical protein P8452_13726 [Trifolium repens]